jgi:hypothetical protein
MRAAVTGPASDTVCILSATSSKCDIATLRFTLGQAGRWGPWPKGGVSVDV